MKAFRGWAVTAGLVFAATAANAQGTPQQAGPARYQAASDIAAPYADAPPLPPAPVYGPPPAYGPGPAEYGAPLLPPVEIYAVLRENGFSPLGVPRLRGLFYSVSAINRRGDDGRLVIDGRDGRIVRFVPAEHYGFGGYDDGYYGRWPQPSYGYGPIEPMRLESPPRPPNSVPKVASRLPQSVPVPKAAPQRPSDDKLATKPAPAPAPLQQSAAVETKPAATPPAAPPAAIAEAKPAAPVIQPTQPMPRVQGLE